MPDQSVGDSLGLGLGLIDHFDGYTILSEMAFGDSYALSDFVSFTVTFNPGSVIITDIPILVGDSLFLQDVPGSLIENAEVAVGGDSLNLVDAVEFSLPYVTIASDALALTDTVLRAIDFILSLSDTLSLADGLSAPLLNFGDIFFLQDSVSYSLGIVGPTPFPFLVSDSLLYIDSIQLLFVPTIMLNGDAIFLRDSVVIRLVPIMNTYLRRYLNDAQS